MSGAKDRHERIVSRMAKDQLELPLWEEPDVDKLLLTTEEVAEVLSIGRTRVYELIATGRLESVKIGASRRVPEDAIRRYVQRLRQSA